MAVLAVQMPPLAAFCTLRLVHQLTGGATHARWGSKVKLLAVVTPAFQLDLGELRDGASKLIQGAA